MRKSFTLIELLIVLVIIGIITTLALPALNKYKDKAKYAEAQTMLTACADSVWRYYLEAGVFPKPSGVDSPPTNLDIKVPSSTTYFIYKYYNGAHIPPQVLDYVEVSALRPDYAQQANGSVVGLTIWYLYTPTLPTGINPPYVGQLLTSNWWKCYGKILWQGGGTNHIQGGWNN